MHCVSLSTRNVNVLTTHFRTVVQLLAKKSVTQGDLSSTNYSFPYCGTVTCQKKRNAR
jgi:hypothetical protein